MFLAKKYYDAIELVKVIGPNKSYVYKMLLSK